MIKNKEKNSHYTWFDHNNPGQMVPPQKKILKENKKLYDKK